MLHFFMFSSFSTATPRVVSSAVIDELLLLWCMLAPGTAEPAVKTWLDEWKKTKKTQPNKQNTIQAETPLSQIHFTFVKLQIAQERPTAKLNASMSKVWVNEWVRSEWVSERENLQHPFFVAELNLVSNVDNLWKYDSHLQHEWVKGMDVVPLRLPQYLWLPSTGSLSGRGKKCWGERYFSWPSYAGLRWGSGSEIQIGVFRKVRY